ncbi:hypothetical protein [Kingella sp. (in: b-proteobacteria)]|uniref:hypothetical protein n=1 Tax=Kingella sp. (in: b-proteobacteria) TaxID=2020713 RepID=UPI0026DC7645|nr:hypothetical protein [Kingella sp. (in: b-proteobacteria)]MDO4658378.1 hypothetical protein [Kingella sp. (in: b-proteobacteria)]
MEIVNTGSKMERRRLAAKWRINQSRTGLPRCQRATPAPLIVAFSEAKIIRQNTRLAAYHARVAQPSPPPPKAALPLCPNL